MNYFKYIMCFFGRKKKKNEFRCNLDIYVKICSISSVLKVLLF